MSPQHREPIPPSAVDLWHTLTEAAVIARRTDTAMRQLRVKGRGPHFRKVDGRLMVSDAELQRWLNGEDAGTESAHVESPAAAKRRKRTSAASVSKTSPG